MKVVRTVALVVAIAASTVATAGAAGAVWATGLTTTLGVSIGTMATIATAASVVATGATLLMGPPKIAGGSAIGSPTDYKSDPTAGIPYIFGRTYYAGNIVYREVWGTDNEFQGVVIVYSGGGPVEAFEAFQIDRTSLTFSGNAVSGGSQGGFMWVDRHLGATPETAMAPTNGTMPGWDANSKLSSLCSALLEVKWDPEGKAFPGGLPQTGAIIKGVKCYDPRLDTTYPGGSGSCRANDPTTWVFSENPFIQALTWAMGRKYNNVLAFGVSIPTDNIDLAAYVAAANVADTNGWKSGGVVSSLDSKWNILKLLCQAGGGGPIRAGAKLSCFYETSRVALDTIEVGDLVGEARIAATTPYRERINTVIPRYRLETHGWEIVSGDAKQVSAYVTDDGGERQRELDLPMVQDKDQAAELAMYEIYNSREFGPITLPLKLRWANYKPGDCLTADLPELGLNNQKCVIINRQIDLATGVVTLELRSETDGKHASALGLIGTVPPTPTLSAGGEMSFPWAAVGGSGKPEDEADVTSMITGPSVIAIRCDSGGTPEAGQLPRIDSYKLMKNGASVTTSLTWSAQVVSGAAGVVIEAGTGVLTTNSISTDSAQVRITAVNGSHTRTFDLVLKKEKAPPSTGGTGSSNTVSQTSGYGTFNSTTATLISSELTITTGPNSTSCTCTASLAQWHNNNVVGIWETGAKWQWWNGSAWVDVGAEHLSVPDAEIEYDTEVQRFFNISDAVHDFSVTKSGLTSSTSYKFRLLSRIISGTDRTFYSSGTLTVNGG